MNGIDILQRSIRILERGLLPEGYSEHGGYCPYCAISLAKTQLDEEHNTGVSFAECLTQVVENKITVMKEDLPLEEARVALNATEEPFEKSKAITAMITGIKCLSIHYNQPKEAT